MNWADKRRLGLVWFTLAFAIGLLYCSISLNSDSLFLEDLATDLFVHGGAWSDWRFTPAPAYVPDMLLYFLGYKVLPSAAARIFFVTACQAFMLAFVLLWLARKIHFKITIFTQSLIILSVAFASLVASQSGMWLFFNTTNNHVTALLFALLTLGMCLDFLAQPRLFSALLIIIAGATAKVSSAIFLICFALPAIVCCLVALAITHAPTGPAGIRVRLYGLIGTLIGSQLGAAAIDRMITYHDPLLGRAPASFDAAARSLKMFLQATQSAFTPDNHLTFSFSLVVVVAYVFLCRRLIHRFEFRSDKKTVDSDGYLSLVIMTPHNQDWRFSACAVLLAVVIPINISLAILSGGFVDAAGYRYFMFPIALGMLLAIISIEKRESGNSFSRARFVYLLVFVLLTNSFHTLIKLNRPSVRGQSGEKIQLSKFPNSEDKVASCLNEIERQGSFLTAGVADYWLARGVSQLMPNKTPIVAVTNNLSPYFWMSSIGPMIRVNVYPKRRYNFAIIHNSEHGFVSDFTPQTIGKLLPIDHSVHFCKDTTVQVWVYQSDDLDLMIKSAQNQFIYRENLTNKMQLFGANLPGLTGKMRGLDRTAKSPVDKPGFLTFGPYIDLKGGRYRVVVTYTSKDNSGIPSGYVELGRFNIPKPIVLHKTDTVRDSDGVASFVFDVPESGFPQFEARTWFAGEGELTVHTLEITKLTKE